MGNINIQIPESGTSLEDLANIVASLAKELAYLLDGNLDVQNIRANSIVADRIKTATITALQIAANTITASKMNVTQLSAIAADLGAIIAGTITGALIRTTASGARIELNANALSTFNASGQAQGINWGAIFGANYGDVGFFDAGFQTLLMKCLGARNGWQIYADSGATMYLGATGTPTSGMGDWNMQGTLKVRAGTAVGAITQANSTATTVAGLAADFNTLLANLRAMNIIA